MPNENTNYWIDYAIKKKCKIGFNTDGSLNPENITESTYYKNTTTGNWEYSTPTVVSVFNLGNQYDHRVTWIEFDLDNLPWPKVVYDPTATPVVDHRFDVYEGQTRIAGWYNYKLYFKNANGNIYTFVFDGRVFYVPKDLTQYCGEYDVILGIVEKSDHEGNINKDSTVLVDKDETFVTAEFKAQITPSIFDLSRISILQAFTDSYQLKTLTKASTYGKLFDDLRLYVKQNASPSTGDITSTVGVKKDNFVTYIGFTENDITSKVCEIVSGTGAQSAFSCFILIDCGGVPYVGQLQKITGTQEQYYDTRFKYIAWIPTQVFYNAGTYDAAFVGWYGDVTTLTTVNDMASGETERVFITDEGNVLRFQFLDNTLNTDNIDPPSDNYYFFSTTTVKLTVTDNFLTQKVSDIGVTGYLDADTSSWSDFVSSDGLIVADNAGTNIISNNDNVANTEPPDEEEE